MSDEARTWLAQAQNRNAMYAYSYGRLEGALDEWLRGYMTVDQLAREYHDVREDLAWAKGQQIAGVQARIHNMTAGVVEEIQ